MGAFDWFWKAMGSTTQRNDKVSRSIIERSGELSAQFKAYSDEGVVEAVRAAVGERGIEDKVAFIAGLAEASTRALAMAPFGVQSQAVLRLLEGDVIQMDTGEGKTLVGAMAATGFALTGKRVHLMTVNNYLAQRDAEWMRPLVEFFGLTVGAVTEASTREERVAAYRCDVVYAPVAEIGFDHLRDNQITRREDAVQAPADVALVDEADSVLIDEALVPLVLAGSVGTQQATGRITEAVSRLSAGTDYAVDSTGRAVSLTEHGARAIERSLGIESLYDAEHVGDTLVRVNLALHAKALLIRDVHYIVDDGKVALVDASRGRVAELQRWPDGLQAAVEAKEGLDVSEGGRILDSITLQALMRRYPQVCGMTGTAVEATEQLRTFYGLRVSVIERATPTKRFDEADRIYATAAEKNRAIVEEVALLNGRGQPVLVGTHDVAESEALAAQLRQLGIEVSVLNAKNDAEEARIIAEAGDVGRVTVSTQMAGRGTDIRLGGADESAREEVVSLGGLAVIGTSRHRTSRLDNQLRGRAGRQGDPGLTVFFVSLEDDVVVTGGADSKVTAQPDAEGRITDPKVAAFIEHCRRVTEGQLLEIHAQTWKYNKLIADHRDILDERRAAILDTPVAWRELAARCPQRAAELDGLPAEVREQAAREIMAYHLDAEWSAYLALMDEVRESIHLRAIARETPIDEYHRIAVREFKELANRAVDQAAETFAKVEIDAAGAHLDDAGWKRPSATWTYMVSDNPLSGGGNSLISGVANIFR
ncbi:accessory Sec system translocase SecA2 [Corynebacterium liangguodongii]|uniref:Protein translocase subunit SecA n=1 Tax=Corynebacterium liangguodongii TaxID=2079535 RepID=A0A2S0WDX3_9CORY|nr:accessory Sec system translocase SecA2 [Corynebacterium liangguodongii]AWB83977.1 accessory Sec system translocase SecA2 [Corynebacterium liangguodongii]PWB99988.1 accessory Sec system translocase SecA2 [Corynebacterium liangguodongii]